MHPSPPYTYNETKLASKIGIREDKTSVGWLVAQTEAKIQDALNICERMQTLKGKR